MLFLEVVVVVVGGGGGGVCVCMCVKGSNRFLDKQKPLLHGSS